MSHRIPPVDPTVAQGRAKELLDSARAKFGGVPNALKTMAHSPAVVEGFLGLNGALQKGTLPTDTREQIALAVSEVNGCDYCLAAHSFTAKRAGLTPEQILNARQGIGTDVKSQAVLDLTHAILTQHGKVSDEQVHAARAAGLSDAELVEVVGNIAVMTLTNFLNELALTDIDFPRVPELSAAATA